MKAKLKNEIVFARYVDEKNMIRCMNSLVCQYENDSEQENYKVPAGGNYSEDRVFIFEPLFERGNEVVFKFIGSCKM